MRFYGKLILTVQVGLELKCRIKYRVSANITVG